MKTSTRLVHERIDDVPLLIGLAQKLRLPELLDHHLGSHGNHRGLSLEEEKGSGTFYQEIDEQRFLTPFPLHVPKSQQNSQGAILKNFYKANNIKPGDQFRVIVGP